ncbi:uncharacterized protein B0I36DRAFT_343505 [Microdochium trichocladiopsis]|uniref:IGFBP N-terminal domain-containing protein n=1 Tax=Microdochium trichocladiopsis TaxID=1682393 RepID=A0A9P9BVK0_9PEZI|nr:uncharacterized protein B0I36DRAFT_343505 [Microdochium trichocladiopsis]KAH7039645.1 hypothetical protein B0I36DRAFT_343505 [Microdochium trichocladiopsis]
MVRLSLALAALAAATTTSATICGYKYGACTQPGTTCVPVIPGCPDLTRCIGQCVAAGASQPNPNSGFYPPCGGLLPGIGSKSCPRSSRCMSDPRVPGCGITCDGAGICVPKRVKQCRGFLGLQCPPGLQCYDDPTDSCDPNNGGADCIGICLVPLPGTTPTDPSPPASSPTIGKIIGRGPRPALE